MGEMGADPAKTLFVGDSNVDIRTAKNGNLTGCGVLWGFRTREELLTEGADHLAGTADELAELILR
jgi:phosphoglycolate phosphatase